jgi:hypothetical protein
MLNWISRVPERRSKLSRLQPPATASATTTTPTQFPRFAATDLPRLIADSAAPQRHAERPRPAQLRGRLERAVERAQLASASNPTPRQAIRLRREIPSPASPSPSSASEPGSGTLEYSMK